VEDKEMAKTRTITDKTIASEHIKDVIDEQVGNLTQNHFRTDKSYRAVKKVLESFARKVAELSMRDTDTKPNFALKDWRRDFANRAEQAIVKNGMEALVSEVAQTLKQCFPDKIGARADTTYAYYKIATYVSQVSRMLLNGLDPKMLTMSDEELEAHQFMVLNMALGHSNEILVVAV
jgi:hypothetical protein